jgi:hypothetical protein
MKLPQILKPKATTDEERLEEFVKSLSAPALRRLLTGAHGKENRRRIDAALQKAAETKRHRWSETK